MTNEEARDLSDKIQGVDSRVSRLESGYQHLATKADLQEAKGELKADMKDLENRLFVRLGLLIIVVGAAVAVLQRLW